MVTNIYHRGTHMSRSVSDVWIGLESVQNEWTWAWDGFAMDQVWQCYIPNSKGSFSVCIKLFHLQHHYLNHSGS